MAFYGIHNATSAGVNNRNLFADYSTDVNANFPREGVLEGFKVTAQATPDASIKVTSGKAVVNCGSDRVVTVEMTTDMNITLANPGNANPVIIALRVDMTANATTPHTVVALEGSGGAQPNLSEGGSPDYWYLPLALITSSANPITNSQITANNSTLTTNANPETILPIVFKKGWSEFKGLLSYVSYDGVASLAVVSLPGYWLDVLIPGSKLKITQPVNGTKYFLVYRASEYSSNSTTVYLITDSFGSLANEVITSTYISYEDAPAGMSDPLNISTVITSPTQTYTSVTGGTTYYSTGTAYAPIGKWRVMCSAYAYFDFASAATAFYFDLAVSLFPSAGGVSAVFNKRFTKPSATVGIYDYNAENALLILPYVNITTGVSVCRASAAHRAGTGAGYNINSLDGAIRFFPIYSTVSGTFTNPI